MRKAIKKPLTTKGLELMLNKLDKLSNNDTTKIDILNNSIMNNWQGIFALKEEITYKKEPIKSGYPNYDYEGEDSL